MDITEDKRKVVYRAGVPDPLTFDEYFAILRRAQTNRNLICTNCPLYRPEGGTIIVYDCGLYPRRGMSDEQLRKTFRVDGYRWGCSKGVHRLKNGLEKRYNYLYDKNNSGGDRSFIRCEYAVEPCGLVLFHYLGDHEKAALISDSSPHGNAKNLKSPFMRTLPIVIHEIKEKARQTQASPCQIFNNLQQSNNVKSAHVVPKLLRNTEQVRNIMKIVRRQMRSSIEARTLLSMIPTSSISLYDYDNRAHGRKLKWEEGEEEEDGSEAGEDGPSCMGQICDTDRGAKRMKMEQREQDYDSDGSADTIDVINVEARTLLSMIPTSSISLYDYDNRAHGRKLKWEEGEEEEDGSEAGEDGPSCMGQICDTDRGAKRMKMEQREQDYDSDGSADTIDVINVEVNSKVEQHHQPRIESQSFMRESDKYHLLIGVTGCPATRLLHELITQLHARCPPNSLVNSKVEQHHQPRIESQSFMRESDKYHLLIGVTGCPATRLLHELITQLHARCPPNSLEIRIIVTERAVRFITGDVFSQLIYQDEDEWDLWKKPGSPVLHLELCDWADGMLIAPLSANSMAKIANGLCDNLLTSVVRAWNTKRPLFYAPAINSAMWRSPLTQQHRKTLEETLGFEELMVPEKVENVNSKTHDGMMASCDLIALAVAENVRIRLADSATNTTISDITS
ncbi:Phosphopantothenoylcysteine decarboxylase [Toxocara canis]|uniref:Phosphopantothenoylcysteine decarboxylase n=1 Tax=Toxocara canis TaxID=6265 RepID=A0A0B2V1G7_TOXCA|nr:Phosphopantothenoylcysteine decarboxylase [Toxocara canis]